MDTLRKIGRAELKPLFIIGLTTNVLCYLALVLAVRFLGPLQVCALIAGITFIFSASARQQWCSTVVAFIAFSTMLALAHGSPQLQASEYVEFGLLALLFAGSFWHWGSRVQTQLILARPDLDASDYLLLTGLMSLFATLLLIPLGLFNHNHDELYLSLPFPPLEKSRFFTDRSDYRSYMHSDSPHSQAQPVPINQQNTTNPASSA